MNQQCSWLVFGLLFLGCESGKEAQDVDGHGSPATAGAQLYRSPAGVAIPFRTSVPEGIQVESMPSETGDAVRFAAMSGEERDDRAFLHFFVAPESTDEEAAREIVRAAAESFRVPGNRTEVQPLPPPSWAVVKYRIQSRGTEGEPVTGWVALGHHGGRWFHILVQQPRSLEERFTRHVEQILEAWRWVDDGRALQMEAMEGRPELSTPIYPSSIRTALSRPFTLTGRGS